MGTGQIKNFGYRLVTADLKFLSTDGNRVTAKLKILGTDWYRVSAR